MWRVAPLANFSVVSLGGLFPGQPGNPVGFAAAPGYPGSLTTNGITSPTANTTYNFQDFINASQVDISAANITFNGCRFTGNGASGGIVNLHAGASNVTFNYCTFCPTGSPSIPNAGWPTGSSGLQLTNGSAGYQAATIPYLSGYEFAINEIDSSGAWTMDHCDVWGFADAISFAANSSVRVLRDCWFHDTRYDGGGLDHTDGPGYSLGGAASVANISLLHCVVAGIGNTNAIAFQAASSYNIIKAIHNYITGFANMIDMGSLASATPTNITWTDNVYGTDIPFATAFFHNDESSLFRAGANIYRRNVLKVLPGTSPLVGTNPQWSAGQDGFYVWPDNTTISMTDFS